MLRDKPIENVAKVLMSGNFNPEDIKITMTGKSVVYPTDIRQKIEDDWTPLAANGYTPGPLSRVDNYGFSGGNMYVEFGETNYKDFRGASTRKILFSEGIDQMPNSPVTSIAVVTKDGKMLIGVRGEDVHQSGNIDAFGGHLHPVDDLETDPVSGSKYVSPYKGAMRELVEEIPELYNDTELRLQCLGLVYNLSDTPHYAFPFVAESSLTAEEILASETDELKPRVFDLNESNGKNIIGFLNDNADRVDPEARITVALAKGYINDEKLNRLIFRPKDEMLKVGPTNHRLRQKGVKV